MNTGNSELGIQGNCMVELEMEDEWEFHWPINTFQTLEESRANALWHPSTALPRLRMGLYNSKPIVT